MDAPVGRGQDQVACGGEHDGRATGVGVLLSEHEPVVLRGGNGYSFLARCVDHGDAVAALSHQTLDVVGCELCPIGRAGHVEARAGRLVDPVSCRADCVGALRVALLKADQHLIAYLGQEQKAPARRAGPAGVPSWWLRPAASSSSPGCAPGCAGRGWLPPAPGTARPTTGARAVRRATSGWLGSR